MFDADLYLRLRAKEGRVYSDEWLACLPFVPRAHPQWAEWQARSQTAARLGHYLARRPAPLRVLDLGCGNGWLANQLAHGPGCRVWGVDRNPVELQQAARLFGPQIIFLEADIFSAPFGAGEFDVVVVASAIQYFLNLPKLLGQLKTLLRATGEIHIVDSPWYQPHQLAGAQARTRAYYTALGFPAMADHYYHHSLRALTEFSPTYLYRPDTWAARLRRHLGRIDSPFPWIVIRQ